MDILSASVHIEGYLQKSSAGPVKSLKKKWFVLRDQEFKEFKNPNDAVCRATCQDMVYIHDIQGVRKLASGTSSNKCAIEVVSRFKKYTLVAPNPIEQDKWVQAFHDAMRNVRMRSQSSPATYNDRQQHNQTPSTPPEVRKNRVSAAECGKSSSRKKRLLSDSWLGKKIRKSASVDDELLHPDRHRHSSAPSDSDHSSDTDDRSHIYDVVSEFKTITEVDDNVQEDNEKDEEVFEDGKDTRTLSESGNELYSAVAPDHDAPVATDHENVVEIIVRDDTLKDQKVEKVIEDASTEEAFADPTYIEELQQDDGVEELRKMIRDSGLEFDDTEDDYEKIEGVGDDDASAMAKLREMLGNM